MNLKYLFLALRPEQWIKNLFIFFPLIFAKSLFVYPNNLDTFLAFFIFSMACSAVYLANDVIDLEKDKLHPIKSSRAVAAGKINVRLALMASSLLCCISVLFSLMLNIYFGCTVVIYLALNYLYSKTLKNVVIIDVFCIGVFFLLRVLSGSIVSDVDLSHWILIMTGLLALFLGFNKRCQELEIYMPNQNRLAGAKYSVYFIDRIVQILTYSILVAYMLYTVDARTIKEFGTKHLIFTIPFVYYGIFRYLYLIRKLKVDGDPTRILLSDKMMQLNILLWIIVSGAVIY